MNQFYPKCDSIAGSSLNGIRQPNIHSCGLDQPLGQKRRKNLKSDRHKEVIQFEIRGMTLCSEDNESNKVDFHGIKNHSFYNQNKSKNKVFIKRDSNKNFIFEK